MRQQSRAESTNTLTCDVNAGCSTLEYSPHQAVHRSTMYSRRARRIVLLPVAPAVDCLMRDIPPLSDDIFASLSPPSVTTDADFGEYMMCLSAASVAATIVHH